MSGIQNKPRPFHRKRVWLLCGLAGAAALALETTGVVWNGVIDGVAAATQVTTTPPPPPTPTNAAPTLKLTYTSNAPKKNSRTIDEGETLTIKVQAKDPDSNFVYLQARGIPHGASWVYNDGKPAVGLFSWTPAPEMAKSLPSATVTFSATDAPTNGTSSLTTTQPVTLHVGKNTPPRLDAIQVPPAMARKKLKINVVASDTDNDILKLTHTRLPAGAKFQLKPQVNGVLKGVLTWTPKPNQAGQSFPITFTVQDDYPDPYQDSQDIVIDVAAQ
jgi:hypothetical protein